MFTDIYYTSYHGRLSDAWLVVKCVYMYTHTYTHTQRGTEYWSIPSLSSSSLWPLACRDLTLCRRCASLQMYKYIGLCTYISTQYKHEHDFMFGCAYTHTHTHTHTNTHIRKRVCASSHPWVWVYMLRMHSFITVMAALYADLLLPYMCISVYIRKCDVCMYARIHAYMHTYQPFLLLISLREQTSRQRYKKKHICMPKH
jgi:hypothetical protein